MPRKKRAGVTAVDVERRLFAISLGRIRLFDTILDKAGLRVLADILRGLLMEWRAYPSLSAFSRKDLDRYSGEMAKIAAGLRMAGQEVAAKHADLVGQEIGGWVRFSK